MLSITELSHNVLHRQKYSYSANNFLSLFISVQLNNNTVCNIHTRTIELQKAACMGVVSDEPIIIHSIFMQPVIFHVVHVYNYGIYTIPIKGIAMWSGYCLEFKEFGLCTQRHACMQKL